MHISNFELINFRNIASLKLDLQPELNFFIGQNGQGKSNLVEAISVLSNGRSFRSSKIGECIQWGQSECAVACSLQQQDSQHNLRIILGANNKEYWVDNNRVKNLNDYLGYLPSVCFSPDDLALIKSGPDQRRNFLDRTITTLYKGSLSYFSSYHQALKQKNALLKNNSTQVKELSAWNQILAKNGAKIREFRQNLISDLLPCLSIIYLNFASKDGDVGLRLKPEINISGQELENYYLNKFEELQSREIILRQSLTGPHRDELEVTLNEQPSRVFASQGQTRSLVLALKLASLEVMEKKFGDSPVVLLDDVDSELDSERSQAFFDMLLSHKRQVLITGTSYNKKTLPETCKILEIKSGAILA